MVSDSPEVSLAAAAPPGDGPCRVKVRLRFRKDGDMRLVSHHDLMRCFERMLRRADLPFLSTSGFNPRPRLVFALSLQLGLVGLEEVADLELGAALPPEEIRDRLARQAPAGLAILSVHPVDRKRGLRVRRVSYRVPLEPRHLDGLARRCEALLAASACWFERTRPQTRRLDLRPYLHELRVLADALAIDLWVTPTGTARPEEVLHLLGLADVLESGAILERTRLELPT